MAAPGLNKFEEAIAWFRKRVPMTPAMFDELTARARKRAFMVSVVAQLNSVKQLWRAIDRALVDGTDFATFKASVALPALNTETVFRTNVQTAYAAGRWKQATDPDVMSVRPFWMFDAVLDGVTSPACRACDGTTLAANDPWWASHQPPLHHACRSGFITLTAAEAKRRGLTKRKPVVKVDDGFGKPPGVDDWEPDLSDAPKKLASIAKKKLKP